jgi:predicted nicotinamide N-methyase
VIAGVPTRQLSVLVGDRTIRLLTVKRLEDYVDTDALLRNGDVPEPPYWAHLWPGSRALAGLLSRTECRGQRVLDLGCGLGLAGLVAATRGARVTVVDAVHAALRFASASAERNGCRVTAVQTDLRRAGIRGAFDRCVAADVTYDLTLQIAVADLLGAHLAPGGYAWCAESVRMVDTGFQRACERLGLAVTECETRVPDDGRDAIVRITTIHRRA